MRLDFTWDLTTTTTTLAATLYDDIRSARHNNRKLFPVLTGKRALPHVLRDAQGSSNSFNSPKPGPGRIRLDCSSFSNAHGWHTQTHTHTQARPLLLLPVASLPPSAASFFCIFILWFFSCFLLCLLQLLFNFALWLCRSCYLAPSARALIEVARLS